MMWHHDCCPKHHKDFCPKRKKDFCPDHDKKDFFDKDCDCRRKDCDCDHDRHDKKDPCRRVDTRRVLFSERGAAQVGDVVAVVIEGDGVNGVFRGTLVEVDPCFIRVLLTVATGPIPAGTLVTILVEEIAAVARIPGVVA